MDDSTDLTNDQFNAYGIMSDTDIRRLGKQLDVHVNKISYAEDLDIYGEYPYGVNIINLGDEDMGGTHWTMWYTPHDNMGMSYYFDSFGAPPEDNIVKLCQLNGYNILYNDEQIQGFNEQHCGVWALLAARVLSHAHSKNKADSFQQFVENNKLE